MTSATGAALPNTIYPPKFNRYRDGGYSRELPPIIEKPKTVELPPLTGTPVLEAAFKSMPEKILKSLMQL